jgi:hypothetical protein
MLIFLCQPPSSDQFMPTSFSSARRTNRFNDIPSLIDFRTARLWPLSHAFAKGNNS